MKACVGKTVLVIISVVHVLLRLLLCLLHNDTIVSETRGAELMSIIYSSCICISCSEV